MGTSYTEGLQGRPVAGRVAQGHFKFMPLRRQEVLMKKSNQRYTFIIDLEKLNTLNSQGCSACGHKFNLGDTAVWACGAWKGGAKVIHEQEAVFDRKTNSYIERKCYSAK
jgi:hypothetical protein